MKTKTRSKLGVALLALGWLLAFPAGVQAQFAPDLTTTDLATIDRTHTYNLGPTGMRGWIYLTNWNNNIGDFGITTAQSPWQILVTAVGTNTPASGIMAIDDVILGASVGAGAVPLFTNDSRKSFGWAIGAAEASPTGILKLKRWRAGVSTDVSLQMGISNTAYSATAPFNCPKSALILSNAINKLPASFNLGNPGNPVLGLAMMASGNTNFNASVQTYARSIAPTNLSLNPNACDTWGWGYMSVFLSEYYLKTGDTNVLSGITKYTVNLAKAQSKYGTFGHGGAEQHADGSFHGSISWYGPVNAAGLVANLGIAMGRKVIVASGGAVDAEIDPALDRASKFFGYYVGKGSIPYGEHEPLTGTHASNGKDCMAAFLFAMQTNRPVETEYFTRMTVAGYNGREAGHTGQGFSYLWSVLAANIGGTNAVASYLAQVRWYLDLERRSDGSFVYDGSEQFGGSPNVTDYWSNSSKYAGMDPTTWYVLAYSLPKQQLLLTGKSANPTNWLSSDKVTNAIWVGAFNQVCGGYNTNQLASAMGDYDPGVRFWAANTIGTNSQTSYAMLISMASSTNFLVREAACQALGVMQNPSALSMLGQRLSDTNIWVRSKASKALQSFGNSALPQLTTMLGAFITNATDPNVIVWEDPIQIANGYLANELFQTLGSSTINAATNLLYPAVIAGLKQPDGMARSYMGDFIQNRLTWTHVQAVAPAIIACVAERSPADRMFSDFIRSAGLATLGKYLVEEGIPLCLMYKEQTWHGDDTLPFDLLTTTYRGAAKDVLPTLYKWQAHEPQFQADGSIGGCCPGRYPGITNNIALAIAAISSDTNPPTLNNFKSITVASANPSAIIQPTNTILLNAAVLDQDGGAPKYTWSKVSGPGTVTFAPNDSTASSNSMATFSTNGTYVLKMSAVDASILNSNIWITYNLGYFDFATYTNSVGAVSTTNVTVYVNLVGAPAITSQPASRTNNAGTTATFTVAATGAGLGYQWMKGAATLSDGGNVSGATTATLTLTSVSVTDPAGYSVVITNASGTVVSAVATLTVISPPLRWDANGTGAGQTDGAGTWLSATNTWWDGAANVNWVDNNDALIGNGSAGGMIVLGAVIARNLSFTNFTGTYTLTNGSLTVSNAITANSASGNITISTPMAGPVGLTKAGAGTLMLNAANTYSGGITVSNGALTVGVQTALGSGPVTLAGGTTFQQANFEGNVVGGALPNTFVLSGGTVSMYVPFGGYKDIWLAGVVSGPGGFSISGGTRALTLTANNTFSGGVILNDGNRVQISSATALGTGPLKLGNSGGGTLKPNFNLTGSPVANPINLASGWTLTVDTGSGSLELSGAITNTGWLTKVGNNTLTLSGVNTYTGKTTVSGGTLACTSPTALGGGVLSVADGSLLNLDYVGTRQVTSLTLGSTTQLNGTYGSSSSSALTQDAHFAGTGTVTVGPLPSLTNSAATGVATTAATLKATLGCTNVAYTVVTYWNTINAGTNAALWTNTAYVGAWTNVISTNLSYAAMGLSPNTTYYFTFRATNAVDSLWATNVQSFATLAPLTPPQLPGSAITITGGVPAFTFATVAGYKYRLAYKNGLTDAAWLPVIAPPAFPPPNGWSATSTGSPMSLTDTNSAGQPQRFYRLEAQ